MNEQQRLASPLAVEMLMHYFSRADVFPGEENESQQEILGWFLAEGIVRFKHGGDEPIGYYKTTERGDALVNHILGLQLPVAKWVVP